MQQPCCRDAHDDQRNVYLSFYLKNAAEKRCEEENHINRVEYDSEAFANTFVHTSRVHDSMCHLVVDNTTTSTDGDCDDDEDESTKLEFIIKCALSFAIDIYISIFPIRIEVC